MSSRPRFTYQGKSMSPFRRLIALPWKCWSAQRGDQRAGRISTNDDSREPPRICPVSSALYCTSSKNIKLLFHPGSRRILPQGMTFRPCCLDSSRAVFPTFWWGGIWPGASANAILSHSPLSPTLSPLSISFFFVLPSFRSPFRIHDESPLPRSAHPPLRFSLSLSCSLFWFVCYKIESSE